MQIERRGLNRPPARSAPFRGKRIWRKFHLGGFHQRGSICPVWFESWQGKFAGGKQLLSKAPRLQTNQRNWSSTSVQIKNRQSTLSMYNITRIVISQWYLGADASMELLSSSNHSLFTKHLSLCKNFSCLSFLASLSSSSSLHGQDRPFVFGHWGCSSVLQPSHLIVQVVGKTISRSFHSKQKLQLAANTT